MIADHVELCSSCRSEVERMKEQVSFESSIFGVPADERVQRWNRFVAINNAVNQGRDDETLPEEQREVYRFLWRHGQWRQEAAKRLLEDREIADNEYEDMIESQEVRQVALELLRRVHAPLIIMDNVSRAEKAQKIAIALQVIERTKTQHAANSYDIVRQAVSKSLEGARFEYYPIPALQEFPVLMIDASTDEGANYEASWFAHIARTVAGNTENAPIGAVVNTQAEVERLGQEGVMAASIEKHGSFEDAAGALRKFLEEQITSESSQFKGRTPRFALCTLREEGSFELTGIEDIIYLPRDPQALLNALMTLVGERGITYQSEDAAIDALAILAAAV